MWHGIIDPFYRIILQNKQIFIFVHFIDIFFMKKQYYLLNGKSIFNFQIEHYITNN